MLAVFKINFLHGTKQTLNCDSTTVLCIKLCYVSVSTLYPVLIVTKILNEAWKFPVFSLSVVWTSKPVNLRVDVCSISEPIGYLQQISLCGQQLKCMGFRCWQRLSGAWLSSVGHTPFTVPLVSFILLYSQTFSTQNINREAFSGCFRSRQHSGSSLLTAICIFYMSFGRRFYPKRLTISAFNIYVGQVQYLAQRHFGMQMGKTEDRTSDLLVGDNHSTPLATAAHMKANTFKILFLMYFSQCVPPFFTLYTDCLPVDNKSLLKCDWSNYGQKPEGFRPQNHVHCLQIYVNMQKLFIECAIGW